jgi:hypothetical protein
VKAAEVALAINAHLQRFEKDPDINVQNDRGLHPYFHAGSVWRGGPYISVRYVSYQGSSKLRKKDAVAYLGWLDAGNVGKHWAALEPKERFWCTRCNDQIDTTVDGACSCAGVVVKDGVVRVVYTPAPFGIEPPPGLMWEE